MNRAFEPACSRQSLPNDPAAQAMLAAYDAVLRPLAQTYDNLDFQQTWCQESEEWSVWTRPADATRPTASVSAASMSSPEFCRGGRVTCSLVFRQFRHLAD